MLPIFDMLTKAQNGNAIETMAKQFGLSAEQTQAALEALTPAFSTGLKRNASDPMGVAGFMEALASGKHAQYHDDMSKAFQPAGIAEGNGILGHLFGSKDVSRAVADQASKATGIGQSILKEMLPIIASSLMGGMYKQTTQPEAFGAQSGGNGNIIGQVIEQMMRQSSGGSTGQQSSPRNPNPMDNPFGKVLQDMFGGGGQQAQPEPQARQPQQQQNPFDPANNPLGKIFEEMMGGGNRQQQPQAQQPQRETARRKSENPYEDLFGDMFETGKKQQEQYQRSVESIFEQYLDGMNRPN